MYPRIADPIPFYDFNVWAGQVEVFADEQPYLPDNMLYIPGLRSCDCALRVKGDSMDPIIEDNDIIAIRQVKSHTDISWRSLHVIITDTSRLVKYLHRGDSDTLILLSANPSYEPKVIPQSSVHFFYEVVVIIKAKFLS